MYKTKIKCEKTETGKFGKELDRNFQKQKQKSAIFEIKIQKIR